MKTDEVCEIEVNGGAGQVIDLPLFDPMFMAMGPQAASYHASMRRCG